MHVVARMPAAVATDKALIAPVGTTQLRCLPAPIPDPLRARPKTFGQIRACVGMRTASELARLWSFAEPRNTRGERR